MIDRECGGKSMDRQTLIEVAGPSQTARLRRLRARLKARPKIANEPTARAILLAMAIFVLVVDASIMNVSISECQLVSAGRPCQDQVTDAQWPDCPIRHHVGGPTVTNHPCVGEARSDLAVGLWSHLNHPD